MADESPLADWVWDARQRTLELVEDLSDEQLIGPRLEVVNPLLWEIAHAAWFQEKWVLCETLGHRPLQPDGDRLFDSIGIPHQVRWDLPLPPRDRILAYVRQVRQRVLEELERGEPDERLAYVLKYSVFHEDMHTEAFTYTRQTLGYPPPKLSLPRQPAEAPGERPPADQQQVPPGDIGIPGGRFLLGAGRDEPFVFDNEKWAHPTEVAPFAIARTAVTQAEFQDFVDDGGYRRQAWWGEQGWQWRQQAGAEHPVYWQREGPGRWLRRWFDRWVPLEPDLPMLHVNWHEARAYCRWAGRRLPSEAEWELAAASEPDGGRIGASKRRFPWGDAPPADCQANLDWRAGGTLPVTARAPGESAWGCRQLIGNVWEWTASPLVPYPGFTPDFYRQYSQSSFGTHRVLRGGCWATRARLLRNTWRDFYTPDRRDVWAGFRTCAL